MVDSRENRRASREPEVRRLFGDQSEAVLDLLELVELAWHDCYSEVTPPEGVVTQILTASEGDLATLMRAARLAVRDRRDLQLWAEDVQRRR